MNESDIGMWVDTKYGLGQILETHVSGGDDYYLVNLGSGFKGILGNPEKYLIATNWYVKQKDVIFNDHANDYYNSYKSLS